MIDSINFLKHRFQPAFPPRDTSLARSTVFHRSPSPDSDQTRPKKKPRKWGKSITSTPSPASQEVLISPASHTPTITPPSSRCSSESTPSMTGATKATKINSEEQEVRPEDIPLPKDTGDECWDETSTYKLRKSTDSPLKHTSAAITALNDLYNSFFTAISKATTACSSFYPSASYPNSVSMKHHRHPRPIRTFYHHTNTDISHLPEDLDSLSLSCSSSSRSPSRRRQYFHYPHHYHFHLSPPKSKPKPQPAPRNPQYYPHRSLGTDLERAKAQREQIEGTSKKWKGKGKATAEDEYLSLLLDCFYISQDNNWPITYPPLPKSLQTQHQEKHARPKTPLPPAEITPGGHYHFLTPVNKFLSHVALSLTYTPFSSSPPSPPFPPPSSPNPRPPFTPTDLLFRRALRLQIRNEIRDDLNSCERIWHEKTRYILARGHAGHGARVKLGGDVKDFRDWRFEGVFRMGEASRWGCIVGRWDLRGEELERRWEREVARRRECERRENTEEIMRVGWVEGGSEEGIRIEKELEVQRAEMRRLNERMVERGGMRKARNENVAGARLILA